MTCHDGFTLNDLVSYNGKHNEDNGENNRDGADHNLSWNCGAEGPTNDPEIDRLRKRQIKNFLTLTLLSTGVPMLLMGDEVRRTQNGNNNAFCQDNEISWFDWDLVQRNADLLRFVKAADRPADEPQSSFEQIEYVPDGVAAAATGAMAWREAEPARLGICVTHAWRERYS